MVIWRKIMEIEGITYLNKPENKSAQKKGIAKILAIILVVLIVGIAATVLIIGRYRATTMKLIRVVGQAEAVDEDGKQKELKKDMRLHSGDKITTQGNSVVSINMDDTKVVTLEEYTTANFVKKGKQLQIDLEEGGLFFNVKQPLETDESFDIKTQTMTVGIRGTSGYISRNKFGNESLTVTSGRVHVVGINPKTKETKEIDVVAGQILYTYLYSDKEFDTIVLEVKEMTPEGLPSLALTMIKRELALLNKVCSETGWDANYILSLANGTAYLVAVEEDIEEDEDAFIAVGPTEVKRSTPTPTTVPVEEPEETEDPNSKNTKKPKTKTPKQTEAAATNDEGGNDEQPQDTQAQPQDTKPAATATPKPTAAPSTTSKPSATTPTPKSSSTTPTPKSSSTTPTPKSSSTTPTAKPSSNPTAKPSNNPTTKPTTTTPTVTTTPSVTTTPTVKPTDEPTVAVTPVVTDTPTDTPTNEPTNDPTPEPTGSEGGEGGESGGDNGDSGTTNSDDN